MRRFLWVFVLALVVTVVIADPVWASETGGETALPWESGLLSFRKSITGPVAFAVGIICIVGVGYALAFGGDMNGVLRGAIVVILVLAFIVSAPSMLKIFYSEAATIAQAPPLVQVHVGGNHFSALLS